MGDGTIQVEVVFALPDACWRVTLRLPAGSTANDALVASAMATVAGSRWSSPAGLAVFGGVVLPETVLRDGDRLELLRPLVADPKQARRERASGPARGA